MASSKQLSTDEVEALIDGLSDTSESMQLTWFFWPRNTTIYISSDDLSVLGDYYALRMINERFADWLARCSSRCCVYSHAFHRSLPKLKRLMNILKMLKPCFIEYVAYGGIKS